MILTRRRFLTVAVPLVLAAPAVVRASSLMPVRPVVFDFETEQRYEVFDLPPPSAGEMVWMIAPRDPNFMTVVRTSPNEVCTLDPGKAYGWLSDGASWNLSGWVRRMENPLTLGDRES